MKTPLIVANWKMGVPLSRAAAVVRTILKSTSPQQQSHLVLCPSVSALALVHEAAPSILLGAQDCSVFNDEAHTGDTSCRDLRLLGCRFVIVGHSERRRDYFETNAFIAAKITQCLSSQLTPILCIGESKRQRDQGQTAVMIEEQLRSIKDAGLDHTRRMIVAYEPLWAIGAKEPASDSIIAQVHTTIRALLVRWKMENVILLYGGSVDAQGIARICALPNVDGVLVGRASWTASSLKSLVRALKR